MSYCPMEGPLLRDAYMILLNNCVNILSGLAAELYQQYERLSDDERSSRHEAMNKVLADNIDQLLVLRECIDNLGIRMKV